jgi:TetR/AcrR family transcriptional repressor of nem operon
MEYASSGCCKGCLLVNTAIEKELMGKQIQAKVMNALKSTEKELHQCLKAAQERGELGPGKNCSALAKYLMCFLEGLMVMGKTNPSKKSLEPVVESLLATLTG